MEKETWCEDHPTDLLIMQCIDCNKLICTECKEADHKNHPAKDIQGAAANIRAQIIPSVEKLKEREAIAQTVLEEKRSVLASFENSVEETKIAFQDRADAIISCINNIVQEKKEAVETFADQNGRKELCWNVNETEEEVNKLQKHQQAMMRLLDSEMTDFEVTRRWSSLSMLPVTPTVNVSVHQTHLFLPQIYSQWSDQIESIMGLPRLAYTSSEPSAMATALRLTVPFRVRAIHVMSDERVCVVADRAASLPEKSQGADVFDLLVYNQDDMLLQRHTITGCHQPRLSSTPNGRIFVICAVTGTNTLIDAGSWLSNTEETDTLRNFLCCVKVSPSKHKLSQKPEKGKIYQILVDSTKSHLFSVLVENPQSVVADKTGQYFAVIQRSVVVSDQQTKPKRPAPKQEVVGSVAVFKRPQELDPKAQEPLTTFKPHAEKHVYPVDACFYKDIDQHLLLVAHGSAIYMVDYVNTGNPIKHLACECPLLKLPTALFTDYYGRLWIGCDSGKVLNWLPMDELFEHIYMQPQGLEEDGSDSSSVSSGNHLGSQSASDSQEINERGSLAITGTSSDRVEAPESEFSASDFVDDSSYKGFSGSDITDRFSNPVDNVNVDPRSAQVPTCRSVGSSLALESDSEMSDLEFNQQNEPVDRSAMTHVSQPTDTIWDVNSTACLPAHQEGKPCNKQNDTTVPANHAQFTSENEVLYRRPELSRNTDEKEDRSADEADDALIQKLMSMPALDTAPSTTAAADCADHEAEVVEDEHSLPPESDGHTPLARPVPLPRAHPRKRPMPAPRRHSYQPAFGSASVRTDRAEGIMPENFGREPSEGWRDPASATCTPGCQNSKNMDQSQRHTWDFCDGQNDVDSRLFSGLSTKKDKHQS
ncbi:uncharacterized protein [Littorina saxatilis]|uniref:B box-type domain-containing protein n=1 Tax=Littorina saxatilis TaxID=31220 RepID=A0AAN9GHR8_9CAEN